MPRIALHALLEQSARLFLRVDIPSTTAGAMITFLRVRVLGEPDALRRGYEPGRGRRDEHRRGDARRSDVRERGSKRHLYSLPKATPFNFNIFFFFRGRDAR